jgi:hypothetical protein
LMALEYEDVTMGAMGMIPPALLDYNIWNSGYRLQEGSNLIHFGVVGPALWGIA